MADITPERIAEMLEHIECPASSFYLCDSYPDECSYEREHKEAAAWLRNLVLCPECGTGRHYVVRTPEGEGGEDEIPPKSS